MRLDCGAHRYHQFDAAVPAAVQDFGFVRLCAMEVIPETLESFTDLDAYVEISCPRISTDDQERYRKPILNPEEAMVAIGKKSWEDYTKGMTLEEWH